MIDRLRRLKRDLDLDWSNEASILAFLLELKRRRQPFLEQATVIYRRGFRFTSKKIRQILFHDHWHKVKFRANRLDAPMLLAGPFSALYGADLYSAELRGFDLSNSWFYLANLDGADLAEANLSGSVLQAASLNGSNLIGADLRNCDLSRAQLTRGDLIHADLRGANLRGAILNRANLRGANLEGADFRGASLFAARVDDWPLDGVIIDEKTLLPNDLHNGAQPPHSPDFSQHILPQESAPAQNQPDPTQD